MDNQKLESMLYNMTFENQSKRDFKRSHLESVADVAYDEYRHITQLTSLKYAELFDEWISNDEEFIQLQRDIFVQSIAGRSAVFNARYDEIVKRIAIEILKHRIVDDVKIIDSVEFDQLVDCLELD